MHGEKRSVRLSSKGLNQAPFGKAAVRVKPKDLVSVARAELFRDPKQAHAWAHLAGVLAERDELTESRLCFETALHFDPRMPDALSNLGVVLQRLGRLKEAEQRYRQALEIAPDFFETRLNLATVLGLLGSQEEGLQVIRSIPLDNPNILRALLMGATLEQGRGRLQEALQWVGCAADIAPSSPDVLNLRAELFSRLCHWAAALADCERALQMAPRNAKSLHIKAQALKGLGRDEEAVGTYSEAEATAGADAPLIMSERAWLLAEMGRKEEAIAIFDRAIELKPDLSAAWGHRAYLLRNVGSDELQTMERLADNPQATFLDRLNLNFTLGQAYLDAGDGEKAFQRLNEANRLKRSSTDFNFEAEKLRIAQIQSTITKEVLERYAGTGDPSEKPIFVFGMPRSGTTLVEQILASHPSVFGGGETPYVHQVLEAGIDADFAAMGRSYLALAEQRSADHPRFVDKMTWNFLYAGVISLMLPNARLVHVRRDPLDTCLSCYATLFAAGQSFTYNQTELGSFYRLYEGLMAHWRSILPGDRFIEVEYESLVENTEDEVRGLLEFCALPWDERCLKFHQTSRRVNSASLDQVRRPAYKTSVGRSRPFKPWLAELEAALTGVPGAYSC